MNVTLTTPAAGDLVGQGRKPRIMVAGEFSSGKSRLINALIGKSILPSNVTSTALPPVWLTGPGGESCIVGLDGSVSDFDIDDMDFDLETTAFCVLSVDAPILDHVDLIDTPGNSDPNMPPEYWERMLPYADGLLWCSSAMQAWKQSEKANCALMPPDLLARSLLVVTQADRMPDARSADKVLRRVQRESKAILNDVVMGSALVPDDVAEIGGRILLMAQAMPLRGRAEPVVDAMRAAAPASRPSTPIDLTTPPAAGNPRPVSFPAPVADDLDAVTGTEDWGYAAEAVAEFEPEAHDLDAYHAAGDREHDAEADLPPVAEDLDAVSATDDREHDAEADLPPAAEDLDAVSATDDREHDAEADLPPAAEDLDAVSVSGDWEQDLEVDLPPVAAELDAVSVSGEQSEAPRQSRHARRPTPAIPAAPRSTCPTGRCAISGTGSSPTMTCPTTNVS
jgi:hypothetical protein